MFYQQTRRHRSWTALGISVALTLAMTTVAIASHYPNVRARVQRKDRATLEGLARMTYADSYSITVGAGLCDCLEPTCDGGGFMMGCGGEVIPFNGGALTASRRTSRQTCLVCACAGVIDIELRATPVCLGF